VRIEVVVAMKQGRCFRARSGFLVNRAG